MFPSMARHVPHIEERILSYMRPRDLAVSKAVCMEWWYVIGEHGDRTSKNLMDVFTPFPFK